jgi:hypothetical protein
MKKTVQPLRLGSLSEAVSLAAYVAQMLTTEMQWIMNRLQWLFTSQSFLIAAYVTLLFGTPQDYKLVYILKVAIPVLGFLACTVVFGSVIAADHEVRMLANERSRLSVYISGETAIQLLRIGGTPDSRDRSWTQIFAWPAGTRGIALSLTLHLAGGIWCSRLQHACPSTTYAL